MENNKLLIVTASLGLGGIERMSARISQKYVEKGWSVGIVCLMPKQDKEFYEIDQRIKIYNFENYSKKKVLNIFKWINFLKKIDKEFKPTNILAMTIKICSLCILSFKRKSVRIVLRETCDPCSIARSKIMNKITFFLCRNVNGIIFQTNWEKKCYPRRMQKKGVVIPNPIKIESSRLESNSKKNTIITASRLVNYQKHHDILIKAFSLVIKKHPNYILKIFGDGPDFNYDVSLIKKLGLENNVFILKPVKDIFKEYESSKCFVLTSEFEGFCNSLAEAFSLGTPCISTDWNGVEDIIDNGINGIIVKKKDIIGIADAISKLIEDEDLCEKFKNNAIKKGKSFRFSEIIKQYERIIEGK